MSILFISDIHLSESRPAVTELFFRFLKREARGADALYILGDLFDAWIGDDDCSQLAENVKNNLSSLTDAGTKLFLQHGNRDFLIGQKFLSYIKASLLDDYHILEYDTVRVLLTHGDLLCTDDVHYQRFRTKVRKPFNRWCLLRLPLFLRQRLADSWRRQSIYANAKKSADLMDVNSGAVVSVMEYYDTTVLVHGHTHRPGRHRVDDSGKERIVLGEWNSYGSVLSLCEASWTLSEVTL
jgi:UDP-2,3-diacylglucosamine hydrolase